MEMEIIFCELLNYWIITEKWHHWNTCREFSFQESQAEDLAMWQEWWLETSWLRYDDDDDDDGDDNEMMILMMMMMMMMITMIYISANYELNYFRFLIFDWEMVE